MKLYREKHYGQVYGILPIATRAPHLAAAIPSTCSDVSAVQPMSL
jgi:hypothetical protein